MARGRRATRLSPKRVDFNRLSNNAVKEYANAYTWGIQDPMEKLDKLSNLSFNVNINLGKGDTLGAVASAAMIAIYARIELILKEIAPKALHQYLIYLVQNSDTELPEWSFYKALSEQTMDKAPNKPHEYYFYEWTGDLIRNGVKVTYTPGVYTQNILTGGLQIVVSPSVDISPADEAHSTSGLSYDELFGYLEYGTHGKVGQPAIPPRPFFAVVTPKVEEYLEQMIQNLMGDNE